MKTKNWKASTVKRLARATTASAIGLVLFASLVGGKVSNKVPDFSVSGFKTIGRETIIGIDTISEYTYKSVFESKENVQLWKMYEFIGMKLRRDNEAEEAKISNKYKSFKGSQIEEQYRTNVRKDDKDYASAKVQLEGDYKFRKNKIDDIIYANTHNKEQLIRQLRKDITLGEGRINEIHKATEIRLTKEYKAKEQIIINPSEAEKRLQLKKGYEVSTLASKRRYITELRDRYLKSENKVKKSYKMVLAQLDNRTNMQKSIIENTKTKLKIEYNIYVSALKDGYKKEKDRFVEKYKPTNPTLTDKIYKIILTGLGGFVIALGIAFAFEVVRIISNPIKEIKNILWAFGIKDDRYLWFKPKQKKKKNNTLSNKKDASTDKNKKTVKQIGKRRAQILFSTLLTMVTSLFGISPLILFDIAYKIRHPKQWISTIKKE